MYAARITAGAFLLCLLMQVVNVDTSDRPPPINLYTVMTIMCALAIVTSIVYSFMVPKMLGFLDLDHCCEEDPEDEEDYKRRQERNALEGYKLVF
jgi:hypothetical protein